MTRVRPPQSAEPDDSPPMHTNAEHPILNQDEAAAYLRVDIETLRRWSRDGVGPRRTQFGKRFVRYRRTDLDAWLDQHADGGRERS